MLRRRSRDPVALSVASLAWPTAHRRLAHDYERHPATSGISAGAAINGMIRRLAHGRRHPSEGLTSTT
jgi:hypothetical protein